VPRRYSVVIRMSPRDAEDVCFARYVLEDASAEGGFRGRRQELAKSLRRVMEHMSVAARLNDMDALVDSDTQFHQLIIEISGRDRLKDLWSMLNSQMGAVMRAELERQGIALTDTVDRHRGILEAVTEGDLPRLRAELRSHYLAGFPEPDQPPQSEDPGV
jgi:DNA-binding GntR family transcriptional regulator